jgi:F-type H+-transporting ATPase subunit a
MALVSNTAAVSDSTAQHGESLGGWITAHLQNSPEWHPFPFLHIHLPHFEPIHFLGMQIDLSITNHVVMLWFAAVIVVLAFGLSLKPAKKVQTGFGALLEMLIVFIRDEVAVANMGEKEGKRFTPFLVSAFFFILISNLMGLVPMFSTSTANINVTAGLALTTFGATQYFGIKEQGLFGYYKNLVPHGVPL